MKTLLSLRAGRSAFTLVELLISVGIAGVMFIVVVTAWVRSVRSLSIADDYSDQSNQELRAMDFIVRDLRRAATATISSGGNALSMTIPDYYSAYDNQGNPTGNPLTPTIVNGSPVYGNAAKPLTVSYAMSNNQLIRTQTIQATGAVSNLVICSRVNGFTLAFVPLSTTINFTITFDPKYQSASAGLKSATSLSGTVAVRTIRFQ